jgi:outer membrane protein assembly factor BamB
MLRLRQYRWWWALALTGLVLLGWRWSTRTTAHVPDPPAIRDVSHARSTESRAINWPQLRGPTFDAMSIETGLADTWPETGPPVVWTRELGQGYSSFCAVGNRVFTQCQSLYQQSVICLDADSGETVWTYNYGWPYEGGGLYPGPRSTPTWHAGRLYFAAPDGTIGCLDAADGRLQWSCNPKKAHRGRGTDFGYACSPVIIAGKVIVPAGGLDASVVALDARDGSTLWTSGTASASYATPLPILWQGRSLVVTPLENCLAAFDVETGRQQWEVEFSEGYDEHSAAPIYQEPFLVVASPFRAGAKCYRLADDQPVSIGSAGAALASADKSRPVSPSSGRPMVTWETPKFSNDVASSVLVDGRLYGFDLKDPQSRLDRPSRGEFRCLDFESGRVIWSTGKVGQASAIVADRKLILFTDRGEVVLARTGTDEYHELARTQVFRDEICWTAPALHRGCLYLRTQTRAACIDLGDSPHDARRPARFVRDIPRGRALDATTLIGGEREFPATVPDWSEFRIWYDWSLRALVLASLVTLSSVAGWHGITWIRRHRAGHRFVTASAHKELTGSTANPPDPMQLPHAPSSRGAAPGTISLQSFADGVPRAMFWVTTILAGVIGSPLINCRQQDYVLLWPLALWGMYQLTINVITWSERQSNPRGARWISRGCGLSFIGVCALYFHLCRGLGYAIEWSFLVGFLPAFVVAACCARFLTTRWRYWLVTDLIFSTLSFTAYFWFSVMFIKWKLVVGS